MSGHANINVEIAAAVAIGEIVAYFSYWDCLLLAHVAQTLLIATEKDEVSQVLDLPSVRGVTRGRRQAYAIGIGFDSLWNAVFSAIPQEALVFNLERVCVVLIDDRQSQNLPLIKV